MTKAFSLQRFISRFQDNKQRLQSSYRERKSVRPVVESCEDRNLPGQTFSYFDPWLVGTLFGQRSITRQATQNLSVLSNQSNRLRTSPNSTNLSLRNDLVAGAKKGLQKSIGQSQSMQVHHASDGSYFGLSNTLRDNNFSHNEKLSPDRSPLQSGAVERGDMVQANSNLTLAQTNQLTRELGALIQGVSSGDFNLAELERFLSATFKHNAVVTGAQSNGQSTAETNQPIVNPTDPVQWLPGDSYAGTPSSTSSTFASAEEHEEKVFHPLLGSGYTDVLAVGPDQGNAPLVKVYDPLTRQLKFTINAYQQNFLGGVRVAVGDMNNDGTADIITAQGPGGQNRIKIFSGVNGNQLASYIAFSNQASDGVNVAVGDVTGDGTKDVIAGTDQGSTPQIKVFRGMTSNVVSTINVAALSPLGGVRVTSADLNLDGFAEIIAGSGPGANSRVVVLDGQNKAVERDFFAFKDQFLGGVNLTTGDMNADGIPEIIVGSGPQGGPFVRVFDGDTLSPTVTIQAAATSFQGGIRVSTVDVNGDGYLDIVTGLGPNGNQLQMFNGRDFSFIDSMLPYGANFNKGLFVAGSGYSPGVIVPHVPCMVTIDGESSSSSTSDVIESSMAVAQFELKLNNAFGSATTVNVSWSGSATSGSDYTAPPTSYLVPSGVTTYAISVNLLDDSVFEGLETITLTVLTGTGYCPGKGGTVGIIDDDGPSIEPPLDGANCVCPTDVVGVNAGNSGNLPVAMSEAPVRYANGAISAPICDFGSGFMGTPWFASRYWTNQPGYDKTAYTGNNIVAPFLPTIATDSAGKVAVISGSTTSRMFEPDGSGGFTPKFFQKESLTYSSGAGEYSLIDSIGNQIKFFDFNTSLAANKRGSFKSFTDPGGNVISVTSWTTNGSPQEVQRSTTQGSTTYTESFLLTFYTSGTSNGLISNIQLRRQTNGGSWSIVRQSDYVYYDGTESHGNANDLKKVTVKDGAGTVLDTNYYRYYTSGEANGYVGGLKYAFSATSYARLAAAFTTPETATNSQIAPFADSYFEYDTAQRVTKAVVQGAGCSTCTDGQGTYLYSYVTSAFPDGFNNWRHKTVVTLPDSNLRTVFTNYAGETILSVYKETSSGSEWKTFYKYDSNGRVLSVAHPSAVSGYDTTKADLLDNQSGNYAYLNDSTGLIDSYTYYSSTTATGSTSGGVAGFINTAGVRKGETASTIVVSEQSYYAYTAGGVTVFPVAANTRYGNTNGTGARTTSYSYTYFSSQARIQSITESRPVVSSSQNGPGTADQTVVYFDSFGRSIWHKDPDGYLFFSDYDHATSVVSKIIRDVDTSQTSDFSSLPSGWSTPSGGGLHLKSLKEVDSLGRTTKFTDPKGILTYTVFLDTNYEIRVYPAWDTTGNVPTGPTEVYRTDRPGSYRETLTMSASPTVSSGRPTGAEGISGLQTFSRSYISSGGQMTREDKYHDFTSLAYSTSTYIGTSGTNYYTTTYDYNHRGLLHRKVSPTGTIERTIYDGLNRPVAAWIGTNDTPASGWWSPTNNTSPANMTKVSEEVYDGGGVGNGYLTESRRIPGGGTPDRVTQYAYDWRGRLVATKLGVETSESTSLNRPVYYKEYDNLGGLTSTERYDGDGVIITNDTNSDGVPDKPSGSLLRARLIQSFDAQGRVYLRQEFSVDQSTGSVSTDSLNTSAWYGRRGKLIKTALPGGMVIKALYDGVGRTFKQYYTDGGGDTSWNHAGEVTGDVVLVQNEMQYDANGNNLSIISKNRFHDATATGELGNAVSNPKARVEYVGLYYDLADRLTDMVMVGTNAGSAWTRHSSVPSRSDSVLIDSVAYNASGWTETSTDPRGIVSKTYYDRLGRTVKSIQAYVDGTPSNSDDKTVEYTFDGSNHVLTLKASLSGGAYETTQWIYGVSTGTGSAFNCNDCLAEIRFADKTTGNPSSTEKESFTVNTLHQRVTTTDRNASIHTYLFDVVGRPTSDAVTTLGSGVDGGIRRLETSYDTGGRPYLFTSYDTASSGAVVNQVQQAFNGLGQLIAEYQSSSGAVNTGTTPRVQYSYSEMASGANHSRLTSMTYPNGRVLNYSYASGLDDRTSRLTSITDGGTTLESYSYLGLGTIVQKSHPQSGVDLTYIKQAGEADGDAGDQYTGLDRFGRVVDQRWRRTSDGSHVDRFKYAYDRNNNRLYEENLVDSTFSELYHVGGSTGGYDLLNQVTDFKRGTLSDSNSDGVLDTVSSSSRTQNFVYDALGNWSSVTTDGSSQTRGHNAQNQITSISGATTPTFDANGNMTRDETGKLYVYDAWNRIKQVNDSGGTPIIDYAYDAKLRRISEGSTKVLFYSSQWQVIEERDSGVARVQQVWSPVYQDALIVRDRDSDSNGSLEERIYSIHDANWDVRSVTNASGAVQERFTYDPYGMATVRDAAWSIKSGGSTISWQYLHQGGRLSAVSGLYSFRNREYSPSLGRWTSNDPVRFSARDASLYRYELNNPINHLDPSGLMILGGATFKDCWDSILGIIRGKLPEWLKKYPNWKEILEWLNRAYDGWKCFESDTWDKHIRECLALLCDFLPPNPVCKLNDIGGAIVDCSVAVFETILESGIPNCITRLKEGWDRVPCHLGATKWDCEWCCVNKYGKDGDQWRKCQEICDKSYHPRGIEIPGGPKEGSPIGPMPKVPKRTK